MSIPMSSTDASASNISCKTRLARSHRGTSGSSLGTSMSKTET